MTCLNAVGFDLCHEQSCTNPRKAYGMHLPATLRPSKEIHMGYPHEIHMDTMALLTMYSINAISSQVALQIYEACAALCLQRVCIMFTDTTRILAAGH